MYERFSVEWYLRKVNALYLSTFSYLFSIEVPDSLIITFWVVSALSLPNTNTSLY